MTEAKIGAQLPKTNTANGLHNIAVDLLGEPETIHYAIVALDCGDVDVKYEWDDFGERVTITVPRARIRAIEPLGDGDARVARSLMDQARGVRTGRPVLPLDFSVADVAG